MGPKRVVTATLPDLDPDFLEQLAPPCEVDYPDCERRARWVVKARCPCGHDFVWLFCTGHKTAFLSPDAVVRCEYCGIGQGLLHWPLVTTVPL